MYDVSSYQYISASDEALLASLLAMSTTTIVISLLVGVFGIVCMWLVFQKAGKPGWAAIVPIYNIVVFFQICGINPLVILWNLLPVVGQIIFAVYTIIGYFKLATAFGKSSGFGLGLWFLSPIFMAILAFDKNSKYAGISSK